MGWEDSKELQKWNFGLDCKHLGILVFTGEKLPEFYWIYLKGLNWPENGKLTESEFVYLWYLWTIYPLTCSVKRFLNRGDNLLLNCSKLTD